MLNIYIILSLLIMVNGLTITQFRDKVGLGDYLFSSIPSKYMLMYIFFGIFMFLRIKTYRNKFHMIILENRIRYYNYHYTELDKQLGIKKPYYMVMYERELKLLKIKNKMKKSLFSKIKSLTL